MLYTMLAVAMLGAAASAGAMGPGVMPPPPHAARVTALALRHSDRPGIRVWSTHDEVYRRGERARIYFRTERDAFVTIFRIDTDGRVRVLYPRDPWDDNFVRGGASYVVSSSSRGEAFVVDDDPGVGYVFGVAASDPFNYGAIAGRERWELQRVGDRVHGDPFAGVMDVVDHLLPPDYADYDTHLLPYYVERRYDYPRFVCYDCHSYVGFSMWNPYVYHCSRFSLWVYNDPFYYYPSYWYPTRYYGGTRVVYARGRSSGYAGRYVFKARTLPSEPPIVYRRRSDVAANAPFERGVRGRDIGGVGSVGVPTRRQVEPGTGTPANPPLIRGETGRRGTDQPANRPGGDRPGNQPDDRRGVDRRNDEPAGRPRDERGEPPGRRQDDRRNDEPGGQPRDGTIRNNADEKPQVRDIARPPRPEPGFDEPSRRGVYRPSEQPRAEPRQAEPRREAASPPRSEPRQQAAEPRREASPPPRSEPRAQPQPQSQPRAEPERSSPPPRLERRRPDSER
jgi:hypothetical protein